MSAIVYVERGDLVLTDTQIVAKEFGMKHHALKMIASQSTSGSRAATTKVKTLTPP